MNDSALRSGWTCGSLTLSHRQGALVYIAVSNLLTTFATLGVYHFWARARQRRYLCAATRLFGQAFDYDATGEEGLRQYLRLILRIVLPLALVWAVLGFLLQQLGLPIPAGPLSLSLPLLALGPAGLAWIRYSAWRFRVRRITWAGSRFALAGSPAQWTRLRLRNLLCNVITLGLFRPFADTAAFSYAINRLTLGDRAFRYEPDVADLQRSYYQCWLLVLPTLGCSLYWYQAHCWSHLAQRITLDRVGFRCEVGGGRLACLELGNLALLLLTLGLARPLVAQRRLRLLADGLQIRGPLFGADRGSAPVESGSEGAESFFGLGDVDV